MVVTISVVNGSESTSTATVQDTLNATIPQSIQDLIDVYRDETAIGAGGDIMTVDGTTTVVGGGITLYVP